MIKQLYTFIPAIFLVTCIYSQSDTVSMINKTINTKKFINHLDKQTFFDLSKVDFIRYNKFTDSTWEINFQGRNVLFNTEEEQTKTGFSRGCDIDLIDFNHKRRKVVLVIRYYPTFTSYSCPNKNNFLIQQSKSLYLELKSIFLKKNGEWNLDSFELSDDSFEKNKKAYPCIFENYIPLYK